MTGQVLGPYKILSKLGEGGMGVVYRATDERLGRDVAIKVLPESLARDRERMARFEREARTLASLNHPNIAQLYGVEQGALVMELVEGERLRGPVPVETAIGYAHQMVDALEHAHEKGIVHRDLKPGNIRITPDERVKVLDFGLAKAMEGGTTPAVSIPEDSPTLTMQMTSAGVIVGTAAYMSPEQARGAKVDHRTDIWAFGVVLYEMVTGRSPFKGETMTDTLAAVLGKEPDLEAVPEGLRGLLRLCLQRDVRKRLGWIGDARWMMDAPAERKSASQRRWWIAAAAVGILLTGLVAGWLLWARKPVELPLRAFSFTPESLSSTDYSRRAVISPNGKHIAYTAANKLWIRDLDNERARPVEGSENAVGPFWSPDSTQVAFAAEGVLKKAAIAGGAPLAIARLPGGYPGGAWSPDGLSIIVSIVSSGLSELPAGGGSLKKIFGESETFYSPQFVRSPAGERWVVAGKGTRLNQTIEWIDLKTGKSEILREGAYPVYSASGHILFQTGLRRPGLWALALSPRTGKPEGEPFPVLNEGSEFSTSSDGTLVWTDSLAEQAIPVWRDRTGQKLGTAGPAQGYLRHLSLSPDGTRAAYIADDQGNTDIWILDLKRRVPTRFTFASEIDLSPTWTPSGREIAFSTIRKNGNADIYLQPADGSGEPRAAITGPLRKFPSDWSPDGKTLLFSRVDPKMGLDLWFAHRKPDGAFEEPAPFLQTSFGERNGQFSPDGRYVLYASDESGRREVYVRSFPDGGGKRQISAQGGEFPRWSRDGKEGFYLRGDALFAVPVSLQGSFSAGAAVELFRIPGLEAPSPSHLYDVASDGKRFLIAEPDYSAKGAPASIHVVLNWTALLRKKVPASAQE